VILFLHGSLGNFKGYLWLWKRFADEHGYAVVAPSFGVGNWSLAGGLEAIEGARQHCIDHPRMDGKRIILAGLSNGGMGVSRAASTTPAAYAGLVFISPVIERDAIGTKRFLNGWNGRRVLVLHGSIDRRIPLQYVEKAVALLEEHGVNVESKFYADEDHFLLFSAWNQVSSDIAAWIE
jgi:predicted esterase